MFCFNCGKQLPEEAKFCAYCGINLSQLQNDGSVQDAVLVNDEVTTKSDKVTEPEAVKFVSNNSKPTTPEEEFLWAKRYEMGLEGFERNLRKAFDLYVKSANGGYKEAQFRLAQAYENGELNLKENEEKAYNWYEEAANNGHVEAMFILGEAYEYEYLELDEDEDEAFDWYLKAAKHGHVKAQIVVAEAYEYENLGVDEDNEEALYWYLQAANNGNVEAMYKAADRYYWMAQEIADENEDDDDEEFAVTDEELECMSNAKKWYAKAAENGHKDAARMLKQYFSK